MRRREFITLLGGAAVVWPVAAPAQQTGRLQQIAVLTLLSEQQSAPLLSAFRDGLRGLGYVEGQNVSFDYRYSYGDVERPSATAYDRAEGPENTTRHGSLGWCGHWGLASRIRA